MKHKTYEAKEEHERQNYGNEMAKRRNRTNELRKRNEGNKMKMNE